RCRAEDPQTRSDDRRGRAEAPRPREEEHDGQETAESGGGGEETVRRRSQCSGRTPPGRGSRRENCEGIGPGPRVTGEGSRRTEGGPGRGEEGKGTEGKELNRKQQTSTRTTSHVTFDRPSTTM